MVSQSLNASLHQFLCLNASLLSIKLQPAIYPLSQHVIRFHELPADITQRFLA